MPLLRIIYSSTASEDLTDEDVRKIYSQSVANNKEKNLTGYLIHGPGMFLQIIEGDARDVHTLIRTLKRDERHKDLEVLSQCTIQDRHFQSWDLETLGESSEKSNRSSECESFMNQSSSIEAAESKLIKACLSLTNH